MVKEPRPGRVKTRLGRSIGMAEAAWWYRRQVRALLRRLQDPRWDLALAVTPDFEGMASRCWPVRLRRIPQGNGDLGQRMARVLAMTTGPSVLIGSDIPGVERRHVARAFRALGGSPSVIGPAMDGGFWLVGLRHPGASPAGLFHGVVWSHSETRRQTLPTLPQPVAMVDALADIDEAADLR